MKLLLNGSTKLLLGFLLVGLFLFLPAGTLDYPNGWLFMGVLFVPVLIMGAVLFLKAPELLEKRLNHKEKEKAQKSGLFSMVVEEGSLSSIQTCLPILFAYEQHGI